MHRSICCELLLARPDIFSQDTQSLVFQPAKSVVKGRIWPTLDKDAKTVKPPAVFFLAHLDMFVFNHANSLIAMNQIK